MADNIMICECCAGQLKPMENDDRFWKCGHCSSIFPAKNVGSEKITQLLNVANATRCALNFSDAIKLYKQILEEDKKCSEAYWGLVLSKLGIEYVKDNDGKYIPTCHRISFHSILLDKDYLNAIENASTEDIKNDYIRKAEIIEEIRLKLIELAKEDKSYDVFICFKATMEADGKRYPTKDSELAQRIYHHLDNLGYDVFFSNISLEKYVGTNYEPHIFSALNSCKCMLLVCFNSEYVESTWIKNEWTRYLELIETGMKQENALIPIVKGVDFSQLPYELQQIEALNIDTNIHWLKTLEDVVEELVHNTKKSSLVRNQVKKQEFKKSEKVFTQVTKTKRKFELKGQTTVESSVELKLSIGYKFLARSDFKHSRKQFESIIRKTPEIADAHWGVMLAKLKVPDEKNIQNICEQDNFTHFTNAINYSISEDQAKHFLTLFKNAVYNAREQAPIDKLIKAINTFMEWDQSDEIEFKDSFITSFFDLPFARNSPLIFDALKKFIPESDVDYYIEYVEKFADHYAGKDIKVALKYYDEILTIEKDNTKVLWKKLKLKNPKIILTTSFKKHLTKILEYGFSNDYIIKDLLEISINKIDKELGKSIKVFELAISWIPKDQNDFYVDCLYKFASQLSKNGNHLKALKYYNEMTLVNDQDSRGYIGRLMTRYLCREIDEIIHKVRKPLMDVHDFNNAINCGDSYQEQYIEIASKQGEIISYRRMLFISHWKTFFKMNILFPIVLIPIVVCYSMISFDSTRSIFIAIALLLLSLILRRSLISKKCIHKLKANGRISFILRLYSFILYVGFWVSIASYIYIEVSKQL